MSSLFLGVAQLPQWIRTLFFISVGLVLLAAGLRAQPIPEAFAQEDKLHHLVGFFALSFSCRLAFPRVKVHWIALGCLLTGILIEYAQGLMPLRTASPYDALANAVGVLTGLIAWRWMFHWSYKQPEALDEMHRITERNR
ncbi:VanZ family protein [Pseudomonas sp. B28(2017)]|uniref:VanZ family protein n=1 Tax=Pseudomonas sp. B28(2017) TaxID=1981730 RepID=UPI0015B2BA3D|nr:VanZ family protein [Pseudomonas sp. B28(2017)]